MIIFEFIKTTKMKHLWIFILIAIVITSCQQSDYQLQYKHSDLLLINQADLPKLEISQDVYVPAYSDIYYETENNTTYLTVILSLRNISFSDTLYFNSIEYYGSDGKLLKKYLTKVLVLRPMESMEYIVEAKEKKGGTGANFVVSYAAKAGLKNQPLIETVMMGNLDNYRFSFISRGIPINKE